jgi:hypothetical protein
VTGSALRIAWYRFRVTFAQRWPGYLSLVLLIGLVGGLAMGSIAGARRTQSSYPEFLASTNPSDLYFTAFGTGGPAGSGNGSHSVTAAEIARLAHVKRVASSLNLLVAPLGATAHRDLGEVARLNTGGSIDGENVTQDRVAVVRGRMANPHKADEFVTTAEGARLLGIHVGQTIPLGVYSLAQTISPAFGTPSVPPRIRIDATLVGIVVFNDQVVQDDVDTFETEVLFTPALTKLALAYATAAQFGLQLDHGDRDVSVVETRARHLVPPGTVYEFHRVRRSLRPGSNGSSSRRASPSPCSVASPPRPHWSSPAWPSRANSSGERPTSACSVPSALIRPRPRRTGFSAFSPPWCSGPVGRGRRGGTVTLGPDRPGAPGLSHPGVHDRLDRARWWHPAPDRRLWPLSRQPSPIGPCRIGWPAGPASRAHTRRAWPGRRPRRGCRRPASSACASRWSPPVGPRRPCDRLSSAPSWPSSR